MTFRHFLLSFGIDAGKLVRSMMALPSFYQEYREFKRQHRAIDAAHHSSLMEPLRLYPCLADKHDQSGSASGHYFHQDFLVARRIFAANPEHHVDIGSRIDGFVTHVASFREIEVFDIRPLGMNLPNIKFTQLDLMVPLPPSFENYCDSLSCLHTIEHFGLGRYGDPIHSDGHIIGIDNLNKILKPGGKLYLSTPIGPRRVEFNAHRVFSVLFLSSFLKGRGFRIDRFSYVDDAGDLHENVELTYEAEQNSFGCQYGCGIFELTKLRAT